MPFSADFFTGGAEALGIDSVQVAVLSVAGPDHFHRSVAQHREVGIDLVIVGVGIDHLVSRHERPVTFQEAGVNVLEPIGPALPNEDRSTVLEQRDADVLLVAGTLFIDTKNSECS